MKWAILLVMALVLALVATSALAMTCYQEDNSVPNQTGIDTANCGLNYSGTTSYSTDPPTQGIAGIIDSTWVKPPNARNTSHFKYKVGETAEQIDPIPADCYDFDQTALHYQLKSQVGMGGGLVSVACYNGLNYSMFYQNSCSGTALPAYGSPTDVSDGNWSTYVWFESYPPSTWMKYPDYSEDHASVVCALWDIAMVWDVCTPNWVCDSFSLCSGGVLHCLDVIDNNSCGDTFVGDLSIYNQNCTCTPDWVCSGYGACVSGHRVCNAVTDNNYCGNSYSGNYSEFSPQVCTSGYAPQYGAGDFASMVTDLFGNAVFVVLTLTGVIVIVALLVWGVKKIRGEMK